MAIHVARRRTRGLAQTARVDRRTKNLLQRVQPGEIAVIDHEDLDRVSAEGLVARSVAAARSSGAIENATGSSVPT